MTIKLYIASAIVIATLFSCAQKDKSPEVDESLFTAAPVKPAQVTPVVNPSSQNITPLTPPAGISPATGTIIANPQANAVQAQAPAATASTVTAPGMNPPHGQPGHRCDINVGAPLNSKPAPATAPAAAPIAVNSSPSVTAVPVPAAPTAPGMNPPHGQPNHRCDIAVGAPLNSKPTAAAAPAAAPIMVTPTVVNASDSGKH